MDTADSGDIQIIFGRNLKALRKAMGLSQQALAERSGLSPNYLGSVEIGQKFPSAKTLNILSLVLQVPPYRFFLPLDRDEKGSVRLTDSWIAQVQHRFNDLLTDSVAQLEELLSLEDQVAEDFPSPPAVLPGKGKLT